MVNYPLPFRDAGNRELYLSGLRLAMGRRSGGSIGHLDAAAPPGVRLPGGNTPNSVRLSDEIDNKTLNLTSIGTFF
jgi:hypothetical protein